MTNDRILFMKKFIECPKKIGSITPSSKYLAKTMLHKLPWQHIDSVAELGAGTGVLTKYIMEYKQKSCYCVIVEQDRTLQWKLQLLYPHAIVGSEAEHLPYILHSCGLPKVDCIVSSLPFAVFTPEDREKILSAVITSLNPGGTFVTFQYSLQMRHLLKQYFKDVHIRFELCNLPPAFVYECRL